MRPIAKLLLTGFTGLAAAATCVAHPGHPPLPTPVITVAASPRPAAFELFRGNRIILPGRINGHETKVLLDTGASMTTLDRGYARSINLPAGFKIEAKGVGGTVDAELVSGLTLDLGGLKVAHASVGVMDLSAISHSIGVPIGAIFGREFFNAAVITIDWDNKQITVESHDSFHPNADATAVQLVKKGPFNTIPVSIAGAPPIQALLDLGNGGALALPGSYWHARPELAGLKTAAAMAGGVGGMHTVRAAMVPNVTLAGKTFAAVPTMLREGGDDSELTQMANVGIGLLKQFKVDLDLGRDRIYLTPRTDNPPFDRDRAGARFDLLRDRLKTTFVSPGGPAAMAGLRPGDELVAIDDRRVTPDYYRGGDWAFGPAGRTVVVTRSDGTKLRITLADSW